MGLLLGGLLPACRLMRQRLDVCFGSEAWGENERLYAHQGYAEAVRLSRR